MFPDNINIYSGSYTITFKCKRFKTLFQPLAPAGKFDTILKDAHKKIIHQLTKLSVLRENELIKRISKLSPEERRIKLKLDLSPIDKLLDISSDDAEKWIYVFSDPTEGEIATISLSVKLYWQSLGDYEIMDPLVYGTLKEGLIPSPDRPEYIYPPFLEDHSIS
jgi:hypothetical protein